MTIRPAAATGALLCALALAASPALAGGGGAYVAAGDVLERPVGAYGFWDGYAPGTAAGRYASSIVDAYDPPLEPRVATPRFDPNVSGYRPEFGTVGWYGHHVAVPVAAPVYAAPAYDLPPPPPGCGC